MNREEQQNGDHGGDPGSFFRARGEEKCSDSACGFQGRRKKIPALLCLIPGSRKSPGEGYGNLLHYSCLGNPMDRGAGWATVPGVTKELDMT